MLNKSKTMVPIILVISLIMLLAPACSTSSADGLKVVTSTSLLASIVERAGGNRVNVVNIIPPAQCPGHFDLKPGDIRKLADADLFLMHGWQGEKFAEDLIASANNPRLAVHRIDIPGNWMTPPVQLKAVDALTAILSQADAPSSSFYQERATEQKAMIEAKSAEIKKKLAEENLGGVNVLCEEKQAGFAKWTGLNVVATFGPPDSLTPQGLKELVDKGKSAGVTVIIDNLQSGHDAGAGIAEELGARRTILSNFPGGLDNTETWEKAIDRNIELILEAIAN
ncbi:MAG: metal ABC transporter substrate-binding protein [Chloroflexi bacterium]|nr:metal ABC transporter substrate-binding protein [Chloroflexota bacterium]